MGGFGQNMRLQYTEYMKKETTKRAPKKERSETDIAPMLTGFMRELRADWKKHEDALDAKLGKRIDDLDKKFSKQLIERDVALDKKFAKRDGEWSKNLDKKFAGRDAVWSKNLDRKFAERDAEWSKNLDTKFAERDAEWSKNLDIKFAERDDALDKKFAKRDAEWEKKLEAQNEETRRYIGILSEDFAHKVQLIAEQCALISERVNRMNERLERVEETLQSHTEMIGKLMEDVQDIKHELKKKVDREEVDKLEKRVLALELHVGLGPKRQQHTRT
jgi:hypothetical protein